MSPSQTRPPTISHWPVRRLCAWILLEEVRVALLHRLVEAGAALAEGKAGELVHELDRLGEGVVREDDSLLPLPQPLEVDVGVADEVAGVGLHRGVGVGDGVACCVQRGFKFLGCSALAVLGPSLGFAGFLDVLAEVGVAGTLRELGGKVEVAPG